MTSNPTIFAKAIESGDDYDDQFRDLLETHAIDEGYWELVITDIVDLAVLRPVHDESDGVDGYVSLEVAPAWRTTPTAPSARRAPPRADRRAQPVREDPGHRPGVPAIRTMMASAAAST